MKPDLCDIFVLAGAAALGAGAWMVYPPAALIIVGAIVLGFGVAGAVARKRHREAGDSGGG